MCSHKDGSNYEGQWRNDKPHGWGVQRSVDGSMYHGEFQNGKWKGQGTLILKDESILVSKWSGCRKTVGRVKFYHGDGSYYEGEMRNMCFHGEGVMLHDDGTRYEGQWKNGRENGTGTLLATNGSLVYKGEWKESMMHGQGKYRYPDGTVYVGSFRDDACWGRGKLTKPDGTVKKGFWAKRWMDQCRSIEEWEAARPAREARGQAAGPGPYCGWCSSQVLRQPQWLWCRDGWTCEHPEHEDEDSGDGEEGENGREVGENRHGRNEYGHGKRDANADPKTLRRDAQYGCENYDLCNWAMCAACCQKTGGKPVEVIEIE